MYQVISKLYQCLKTRNHFNACWPAWIAIVFKSTGVELLTPQQRRKLKNLQQLCKQYVMQLVSWKLWNSLFLLCCSYQSKQRKVFGRAACSNLAQVRVWAAKFPPQGIWVLKWRGSVLWVIVKGKTRPKPTSYVFVTIQVGQAGIKSKYWETDFKSLRSISRDRRLFWPNLSEVSTQARASSISWLGSSVSVVPYQFASFSIATSSS